MPGFVHGPRFKSYSSYTCTFGWPETIHGQGNMNLVSHRVWRLSRSYFEAWKCDDENARMSFWKNNLCPLFIFFSSVSIRSFQNI